MRIAVQLGLVALAPSSPRKTCSTSPDGATLARKQVHQSM